MKNITLVMGFVLLGAVAILTHDSILATLSIGYVVLFKE